MHNKEIARMLGIVGIDPGTVPARDRYTASRQMETLRRFVGFRAGLEASQAARKYYDFDMDDPAILGMFVANEVTFRDDGTVGRSVFHSLERDLALIEGATGYPMTSDASVRKTRLYFMQAVLRDIKTARAEATPSVAERTDNSAFAISC